MSEPTPDAPILSDWSHEDCAICADESLRRAWLDAGYGVREEPPPTMNIPALLCSVGVGILLWGLISFVVVLVVLTWQAVA